jgi:hypothetical protein
MKKVILLYVLMAFIANNCISQELKAKEKAEDMAKNVFSKTKYKKKEKDGTITEVNVKIESTPVAKDNLEFYAGNYWYKDLDYKMEIRVDANKNLMTTLSIPDKPEVQLKNVSVTDAYFSGVKQNEDSTEETWEGVFINRSDNGNTEFGLGIKLEKPLQLTEYMAITRIFFKKVSP